MPVFDYTNALGSDGAFYNIGVAGCKDASGNVVQSYGTNGPIANGDITATGRGNRTAATIGQVLGSGSVVAGFVRCD